MQKFLRETQHKVMMTNKQVGEVLSVGPKNGANCWLIDGRVSEVWSLQQQVVTLTQALTTLTEERARTDASFQQDKKNLLVIPNFCLVIFSLVRKVLKTLRDWFCFREFAQPIAMIN